MSEPAIPVKNGDQIPLHAVLESAETDRFVLAHVIYADTKAAVPGSPFELVHESLGRYFPDDPEAVPIMAGRDMIAHYLVFKDAGFTIIDAPNNLPGADFYTADLSREILETVNSIQAGQIPSAMSGEIEPSDLSGTIEEGEPEIAIGGAVESGNLKGTLESDEGLTGQVDDDNEIGGEI